MILGAVCTRACTFCNVATGRPDLLDPHEPERVGEAVAELGLNHIVVTSVDRDDLDDGGAGHFARTIAAIRAAAPATTIEVLVPDFLRKDGAIETVVAARPDVLNHNLETVPRLYAEVRPGARYFHSLRLLDQVKRLDPALFTKSGIMVGLGEDTDRGAAGDGRSARGRGRFPDDRAISAADAEASRGRPLRDARRNSTAIAGRRCGKGFLMVSASPLTRSSYHAGDDFARLRAARAAAARGRARPARCRPMPSSGCCPTRRSSSSRSSPMSSAIPNSCRGASAPASASAAPI